MASPALILAPASCAAARAGAFQVQSGGAIAVMATSGRPVIAILRPVVATRTRLRDHQAKSPRLGDLGLFSRASSIKDVLSCCGGVTGACVRPLKRAAGIPPMLF